MVGAVSDLALASVTENGIRFTTGQPVTFPFIRNTERAPKLRAGTRDAYQQRLEPAGRFLLHRTSDSTPPRGWEIGTVTFQNPLVLRLTTSTPSTVYSEHGWKARLVRHYQRRGAALTRALQHDGYDGVVTVDKYGTSEIVDLTGGVRRNPSCVDGWWAR
jgi:hypothetical protein